jgi:hypothetical protein
MVSFYLSLSRYHYTHNYIYIYICIYIILYIYVYIYILYIYIIYIYIIYIYIYIYNIYICIYIGLTFLMESWVAWHPTIMREYHRKISIVALSNILSLRYPPLEGMIVNGDIIVDKKKGGGVKTRSKEKADPVFI